MAILTNDLDLLEETYFRVFIDLDRRLFWCSKPNNLVVYFTAKQMLFMLVHGAVQMFVPNTMSGMFSNKRREQSESAEHFIATANEHLSGRV